MVSMHPELRKGLADEHIRHLAQDMAPGGSNGRRSAVSGLLPAIARLFERNGTQPVQASSASFTSASASSLCSRRTAVYETDSSSPASRAA
jgi:hypothetical protein